MSTPIQKGILLTTVKDKIATLEFGHPASNSFPSDLLGLLAKELQILSANDAVSVIVLKSSGTGVFCAGASFDELLAVSNLDEATKFFSGFATVLNAMRQCSKIIIGRIQGKAVGGGVGIVAACDYAFATNESAIKLPELAIGIGPFVIEPAISRKIGKGAMTELALDTKQWKSAVWAEKKGLYCSLFETIEDLDLAVFNQATELANYSLEALAEIKKALWEGTENWDTLLYERAAISGKLVLSDFTKNALRQIKK
jgi:methylglutaconyl-CoA hydratase